MTPQEKKELEALRKKADLTTEEKAKLDALEAKAAVDDNSAEDKTYSETYVKSLRSENGKYRTRAKEADEALAKYDGVDIEEYHRLKQEAKDAENEKLAQAGEWDKLKEQMAEAHTAELTAKDGEIADKDKHIAQLEAELNDTILGHEVAVAAGVAKANNPHVIEMIVKSMVKVDKLDDGQRVIRVLDAEKNERADLKTGKPMSIAQLLEEMKLDDRYAHEFAGGTVGSGSKTVTFDGRSIENPWKAGHINLTAQGNILKENPVLAERLKAEAGR